MSGASGPSLKQRHESRLVKACWQISRPAVAWEGKKGCIWGPRLVAEDSIDLGEGTERFWGWEQMSCGRVSKILSDSLWLCTVISKGYETCSRGWRGTDQQPSHTCRFHTFSLFQ